MYHVGKRLRGNKSEWVPNSVEERNSHVHKMVAICEEVMPAPKINTCPWKQTVHSIPHARQTKNNTNHVTRPLLFGPFFFFFKRYLFRTVPFRKRVFPLACIFFHFSHFFSFVPSTFLREKINGLKIIGYQIHKKCRSFVFWIDYVIRIVCTRTST